MKYTSHNSLTQSLICKKAVPDSLSGLINNYFFYPGMFLLGFFLGFMHQTISHLWDNAQLIVILILGLIF